MMLAWYFHKREGALRGYDFLVAALLLAVPVALILKQQDSHRRPCVGGWRVRNFLCRIAVESGWR